MYFVYISPVFLYWVTHWLEITDKEMYDVKVAAFHQIFTILSCVHMPII